MTTGQTMLAVGALVLLTTIMMNFYRIYGSSWDALDNAQLGIDATTIATSYMEIAHGLAFDRNVLDDTIIIENTSDLTFRGDFGKPDTINHISEFTVFDYFDGFIDTTTVVGVGTYETEFEVNYVLPHDVRVITPMESFVKRLDMTIRRIDPPPTADGGVETVRMWTVMGYFSFQ